MGGRLKRCSGQGDEEVGERDVELQALKIKPHRISVAQSTRADIVADRVRIFEAKQRNKGIDDVLRGVGQGCPCVEKSWNCTGADGCSLVPPRTKHSQGVDCDGELDFGGNSLGGQCIDNGQGDKLTFVLGGVDCAK